MRRLYRVLVVGFFFGLLCIGCMPSVKKELISYHPMQYLNRGMGETVLEKHQHVYDHCVCSCGAVEYLDEDDGTVIVSSMNAKSFPVVDGHITIPATITKNGMVYEVAGLGSSCLKDRTEIVSVSMPDTVRYLGPWCFDGCSNLQTVYLSNNIRVIDMAAFQLCTSLQEMVLPDSVEYISDFAYNHCSSAGNTSLYVPASLTRIGKSKQAPTHMFYDCGTDVFTEFIVEEGNPSYQSIDGILYSKDGTVLVSIPRGKTFQNETYVMPDTVEWLGELSFSRNQNIHTVVLSDSLVVDSGLTREQRAVFTNRGNDLSNACYGYSGVAAYVAKETNPRYSSVDGVLYTKDGTELVAVPMQYAGVLKIPEGVEYWQEDAVCTDVDYFDGIAMDKITEIQIPSTIEGISEDQIETINRLADRYGTKIVVSDGNPWFTVENGYLTYL